MSNCNFVSPDFEQAARDYHLLLNRGYPEKESLKLVGDRHRLTGLQRSVLFRGITSAKKAKQRISKQIRLAHSKGFPFYIDGYNVLFTIMNYLYGKALFIGNDGILRDSGETYGKIEQEDLFYKSGSILFFFLKDHLNEPITVYLDQPVTGSDDHKEKLKAGLSELNLNMEIYLVPLVDKTLQSIKHGIIATSDSEIIDRTSCNVVDLARDVLEGTYETSFPDLSELIKTQ